MLNLIKYEIQRRTGAILTSLLIMVVLQSFIVFGFYRGGSWIVLSTILLALLTIGVYLFVLFDGIRTYYYDLNSSEGYMLFLTPNSGYKILGSKLIVSFCELLFYVMIAISLLLLDYFIVKSLFIDSGSAEIQLIFNRLATSYKSVTPSIGSIFVFSFTTILQWFNVITMAVMAITLTKTILSDNKYNWLISLAFFLVINIGLQFLSMGIIASFGFLKDVTRLAGMEGSTGELPEIGSIIMKFTGIMTVLYAIYISISYYVSARLLDKRIDI